MKHGPLSTSIEIKTLAVRLLAAREHTRKELLRKLAGRGYARQQVEVVLDSLAQQGLQSDARFTKLYIEGRVRKGSGPLRIRAELRERGIDDSEIESGLTPYAEQWWERLCRVHAQKYGVDPPQNRKELAKRARFLKYRGFPGELIAELLFHQY